MKRKIYYIFISIIIGGLLYCLYLIYSVNTEKRARVNYMLQEIKKHNLPEASIYWKGETNRQFSEFKEFLKTGDIEEIKSYTVVDSEYGYSGSPWVIVYVVINDEKVPVAFFVEKGEFIGYSAHNTYIETLGIRE